MLGLPLTCAVWKRHSVICHILWSEVRDVICPNCCLPIFHSLVADILRNFSFIKP